jgi:uncharacterized protein
MPKRTILDAGPIVAYFDREDAFHKWATDQFKQIRQACTCEAVLAEACARLAYHRMDQSAVMDLLCDGKVFVKFDLEASQDRVKQLMKKYKDQPMDLADACLVAMTELYDDCEIVTLDKTDFAVYRRFGRGVVPTVTP